VGEEEVRVGAVEDDDTYLFVLSNRGDEVNEIPYECGSTRLMGGLSKVA
jgi:hypothetical protein